jgi:vesicle-fusing ATPase
MPQDKLHLTALEMTHSKTHDEIQSLVDKMRPSIPSICDYTSTHPTRLIKPTIGFDASALALSYVPSTNTSVQDPNYTYHHLRRDLYTLCRSTGVAVDSRYVVPSSHLTIGRFIKSKDFEDENGNYKPAKMEVFIEKLEEINAWLKEEFWATEGLGGDERIKDGGEWIVGEEKGLNCRMGTLWYGDGENIHLGKGIRQCRLRGMRVSRRD